MIDSLRDGTRRSRRAWVVLAASLVASMAGCGVGGIGSGGPVLKPEDIISGNSTLVDQKTGVAGESQPPPDYGPPTKKKR